MLPMFVKSGVPTVTLTQANVYPNTKPKVLNQFVGISDSNTVYVSVVGEPLQTIVLNFEQLTVADAEALDAFFSNPLVNFGESEFTFIDSKGNSYTCRYLEPSFAIPEVSDDNVKFDMILTIVG